MDSVHTPSVAFNPSRWRLIGRPRKRRTAPPTGVRRQRWRAAEESPERRRNGVPGGQIAHARALQREEETGNSFAAPARFGDGRKVSLRGEGGGARRFTVEGALRWPKWLGGGLAGLADPRGSEGGARMAR